MHRAVPTFAVTILVVLAGCAGVATPPSVGDTPTATSTERPGPTTTEPAPITPPRAARTSPPPGTAVADSGGGDGGGGYSMTMTPAATRAESLGLAVGGAQDATAFRRNVEEEYVPQPTDVTYEGLFHDYYFDTGDSGSCSQLFCPAYSRAVTQDPLSNVTEQYMTVGLNSGLSKADFERKPLNLVVVLDTSGSMEAPFDRYYYDGGERHEVESTTRKIRAASDAVASMTDQLTADDRLGLVTYDDHARISQPLTSVGELDRDAFRSRLARIHAGGSTNLDDGMRTARSMLRAERTANASERETRIIYVTDAMPNTGQTGAGSLQSRLQTMASQGLYSTFVGVGVDFNTRLIEAVTGTRGANYYTVDSPTQFEERMNQGFQYMVTPLVFDLNLTLESTGYRLANVYGTTEEAESTGRLLSVKTLFPSRTSGGKTKGGVILLQLATVGENASVTLSARYENRAGEEFSTNRTVQFNDHEAPYYESTGVRKAVTLQRYATLVRNWAAYERSKIYGVTPPEPDRPDDGIVVRELGQWEQTSVPLRVSDLYRERFRAFAPYFQAQADALGDSALAEDLAVLRTLRDYEGPPTPPTTEPRTPGPTTRSPVTPEGD